MPSAPHSSAAVRLSRRTAALALEYAARPASPSIPAPELKFTMLPPPAAELSVDRLHGDEAADHVDVQLAGQRLGRQLGQW